jgi:hypothetical protein
MATANYKRQNNRQVAVVNMKAIIDDIRTSYPHETFGDMAVKIGVSMGTIKTWYRTERARKKVADALILAYPVPPPTMTNAGSGINDVKGTLNCRQWLQG